VPFAGGGIQLEWHNSGYDVEIEISPDGNLTTYVEHGDSSATWEGPCLPDEAFFRDALKAVTTNALLARKQSK
jgi:hypothetical protein